MEILITTIEQGCPIRTKISGFEQPDVPSSSTFGSASADEWMLSPSQG